MAKLPSVSDLGPAPSVSGDRPVGTYDVGGFVRGGQAIAQGTENLGKGLGALGEGEAELGIDRQRYEYAVAHSGFLTDHIDLESKLAHDQDYATLQPRYEQQAKDLQEKWAGQIGNPALRERFIAATGQQVAQGNAKTKEQAFKLEGNTNVAYVQSQGENLINKTVADPTNDPLIDQSLQSYGAMVDGLQGRGFITPEQALAMKQNHAHQFAIAHGIARSEVDPQGTLNELRAAPGSPEQIDNRIIQVESNGNPLAKSKTSSAFGLGQFTDKTWLDLIKQVHPELAQGHSDAELLSLRADKNLSREMVAANREQNTAYLKGQGLPATAGNIYLAHFLGAADAAKVLRVDPNTPVADILDPKVIAANASILGGKTAGTVAQWAEAKMGGVGPGGGHLYDILRPDQRAVLEQHAMGALHQQTADTISTFHNSVQDDVAQANRTGAVANPKGPEQFIAAYGAQAGPLAYKNYQADLAAGADRTRFAGMSVDDIGKVIKDYTPEPGAGYAAASKRQDDLVASAQAILKERHDDPASFAIGRLPVVQSAYQNLTKLLADPTAAAEAKQAAARDFATKTVMEQQRIGIPADDQRLLPKPYIDQLATSIGNAAASEDPQARVGLIARIQSEAALWGDNWPAVMRQLAPNVAPIVRAIAAGADVPATTRLLSLGKDENPGKILKEQNETKFKDLTTSLNDTMAPFQHSLVGRQLDRDYPGYYGLAEKLGALYVRDGDKPDVAAQKAFNALIGNRYDFRDTFRIPKSAGVSADEVQRGTLAVRAMFSGSKQISSNFEAATADLKLTPQEQALYQRHVTNLTGPGGVDNADGSRSTLSQMSIERDGKTYNVPTVWDGKILPPADAMKRADQEGLDKFPSYGSQSEAEARYAQMHSYMEKDTAQYLQQRKANPFGAKPPIDDMPGRSNAAEVDMRLVGRDATLVTAPDSSGLNMVYNDKFVRGADGNALILPWQQLAGIGRTFTSMHREALARRGISTAGKFAD